MKKLSALLPILLVFVATILRAQTTSIAFDPHCYQPDFTNRSETDSIVGPRPNFGVGFGLVNIGAPSDSPFGSVVFFPGGDSSAHIWSSLDSKPPINLHKMQFGKRINFDLKGYILHVGPIHNRLSHDIVVDGGLSGC